MRIDKLLWFLRLAKTRGLAQEWVEAGHIRRNGQRIERCSASVEMGDVLVLPVPSGVRIIRLITMPNRRGPANEAQSCYEVLDETRPSPLAAGKVCSSSKGDLQP
ncbi:RNA-binding S4 domain-containing protein [Novosphingobium sediminicola]|uniref:Ribosome-associated heat shock protein Hsp15 n=1 Tax=Novosphingobium sediminicola TaxID=563162 RepID=A0A7W6CN02_9SPHN|nr:RNA-binding S4 domain-containing protein [Novosphingobium sediminicola]MBB3954472.1 ribosome-associated heat shock protein Hsp15 [Novosphingobium sediminicola]